MNAIKARTHAVDGRITATRIKERVIEKMTGYLSNTQIVLNMQGILSCFSPKKDTFFCIGQVSIHCY
jgi:hypothetical protein